jgi:hypothetical protein
MSETKISKTISYKVFKRMSKTKYQKECQNGVEKNVEHRSVKKNVKTI